LALIPVARELNHPCLFFSPLSADQTGHVQPGGLLRTDCPQRWAAWL